MNIIEFKDKLALYVKEPFVIISVRSLLGVNEESIKVTKGKGGLTKTHKHYTFKLINVKPIFVFGLTPEEHLYPDHTNDTSYDEHGNETVLTFTRYTLSQKIIDVLTPYLDNAIYDIDITLSSHARSMANIASAGKFCSF